MDCFVFPSPSNGWFIDPIHCCSIYHKPARKPKRYRYSSSQSGIFREQGAMSIFIYIYKWIHMTSYNHIIQYKYKYVYIYIYIITHINVVYKYYIIYYIYMGYPQLFLGPTLIKTTIDDLWGFTCGDAHPEWSPRSYIRITSTRYRGSPQWCECWLTKSSSNYS